MATERNKFEFEADFSKVLAGQKQLLRAVATTGMGYDKMGQKSGAAGDKASSSAKSGSKAWGELGSTLTTMVSVGGAIGLVKTRFQEILDLQKEIKNEQLTLNVARQGLLTNLLGVPSQQQSQILDKITEVSRSRRVGEQFITQAVSKGVTSAGPQRAREAIGAVNLAATLFPQAPTDISQFAGTLLDLQQVTGTFDPRVNAGLLATIQAQSQLSDPRRIATAAPPALVSAGVAGFEPRGGAALFSTISKLLVDPLGETTRTAQISFVRQLDKFFAEPTGEQRQLFTKAEAQKQAAKEKIIGGFAGEGVERISFLQRNPLARAAFLKGATFEQRAALPLQNLITGGTPQAAKFAETFAQIPASLDKMAAAADALVGARDVDPLEVTAVIDRATKSAAEILKTGAIAAGQKDAVREGVFEALRASGQSFLTRGVGRAEFEIQTGIGGVDPRAAGGLQLINRARRLRMAAVPEAVGVTITGEQRQENLRQAAELESLAIEFGAGQGRPGGAPSAIGDPGLAGPPGMFNAGPFDASFGGLRGRIGRVSGRGGGVIAQRFAERASRMSKVDDRLAFGNFRDFRALKSNVDEAAAVEAARPPVFPTPDEVTAILNRQTDIMEEQQADRTGNILRGFN